MTRSVGTYLIPLVSKTSWPRTLRDFGGVEKVRLTLPARRVESGVFATVWGWQTV
jgi:hypothetical protein